MGSVGIMGGRLTGSGAAALVNGQVTRSGRIPASVRVDNPDGKRAFSVNMRSASQDERRSFMTLWTGKANVDNSEKSARAAYNRAIRAGASESDAQRAADAARTEVTKRAMRGVLSKYKSKFPNIYIED